MKTKHKFGNGTSGAGFMLRCYYYYYYYFYYKRKINLERKYARLQVQTYNPDEVIVIISVQKYLVVML